MSIKVEAEWEGTSESGPLPVIMTKHETKSDGGGRRPSIPLRCKVSGCASDITSAPKTHQRFRLCNTHIKAPVILVDGIASRFCQQCSRFHPLSDFFGTNRTCQMMLVKNRARQRNAAAAVASGDSAQVGQAPAPALLELGARDLINLSQNVRHDVMQSCTEAIAVSLWDVLDLGVGAVTPGAAAMFPAGSSRDSALAQLAVLSSAPAATAAAAVPAGAGVAIMGVAAEAEAQVALRAPCIAECPRVESAPAGQASAAPPAAGTMHGGGASSSLSYGAGDMPPDMDSAVSRMTSTPAGRSGVPYDDGGGGRPAAVGAAAADIPNVQEDGVRAALRTADAASGFLTTATAADLSYGSATTAATRLQHKAGAFATTAPAVPAAPPSAAVPATASPFTYVAAMAGAPALGGSAFAATTSRIAGAAAATVAMKSSGDDGAARTVRILEACSPFARCSAPADLGLQMQRPQSCQPAFFLANASLGQQLKLQQQHQQPSPALQQRCESLYGEDNDPAACTRRHRHHHDHELHPYQYLLQSYKARRQQQRQHSHRHLRAQVAEAGFRRVQSMGWVMEGPGLRDNNNFGGCSGQASGPAGLHFHDTGSGELARSGSGLSGFGTFGRMSAPPGDSTAPRRGSAARGVYHCLSGTHGTDTAVASALASASPCRDLQRVSSGSFKRRRSKGAEGAEGSVFSTAVRQCSTAVVVEPAHGFAVGVQVQQDYLQPVAPETLILRLDAGVACSSEQSTGAAHGGVSGAIHSAARAESPWHADRPASALLTSVCGAKTSTAAAAVVASSAAAASQPGTPADLSLMAKDGAEVASGGTAAAGAATAVIHGGGTNTADGDDCALAALAAQWRSEDGPNGDGEDAMILSLEGTAESLGGALYGVSDDKLSPLPTAIAVAGLSSSVETLEPSSRCGHAAPGSLCLDGAAAAAAVTAGAGMTAAEGALAPAGGKLWPGFGSAAAPFRNVQSELAWAVYHRPNQQSHGPVPAPACLPGPSFRSGACHGQLHAQPQAQPGGQPPTPWVSSPSFAAASLRSPPPPPPPHQQQPQQQKQPQQQLPPPHHPMAQLGPSWRPAPSPFCRGSMSDGKLAVRTSVAAAAPYDSPGCAPASNPSSPRKPVDACTTGCTVANDAAADAAPMAGSAVDRRRDVKAVGEETEDQLRMLLGDLFGSGEPESPRAGWTDEGPQPQLLRLQRHTATQPQSHSQPQLLPLPLQRQFHLQELPYGAYGRNYSSNSAEPPSWMDGLGQRPDEALKASAEERKQGHDQQQVDEHRGAGAVLGRSRESRRPAVAARHWGYGAAGASSPPPGNGPKQGQQLQQQQQPGQLDALPVNGPFRREDEEGEEGGGAVGPRVRWTAATSEAAVGGAAAGGAAAAAAPAASVPASATAAAAAAATMVDGGSGFVGGGTDGGGGLAHAAHLPARHHHHHHHHLLPRQPQEQQQAQQAQPPLQPQLQPQLQVQQQQQPHNPLAAIWGPMSAASAAYGPVPFAPGQAEPPVARPSTDRWEYLGLALQQQKRLLRDLQFVQEQQQRLQRQSLDLQLQLVRVLKSEEGQREMSGSGGDGGGVDGGGVDGGGGGGGGDLQDAGFHDTLGSTDAVTFGRWSMPVLGAAASAHPHLDPRHSGWYRRCAQQQPQPRSQSQDV